MMVKRRGLLVTRSKLESYRIFIHFFARLIPSPVKVGRVERADYSTFKSLASIAAEDK
ncbi:MAG: hypothetical protein GY845_00245 [Planctomycetes bacterium]|nr:hypothetical protein [Planctomycetota bacterium]